MSTVTDGHSPAGSAGLQAGSEPSGQLLQELRELAGRHEHCSARSRHLYGQLRKMLGQDRLTSCLLGIQELAIAGEPAGARLLAALLDSNTPGSMLLPRVHLFRSTGRLLMTDRDMVGESFLTAWQGRLTDVVAACALRFGLLPEQDPRPGAPPTQHPPLPMLRRSLMELSPGPAGPDRSKQGTRSGDAAAGLTNQPHAGSMPVDDQRLLAGLIRLECEAYQERVSRLAGSIDPYRASAVARVLPLLSRADSEIRDLDLLACWLESGEFDQAFERRIPTCQEVLEESEFCRFTDTLESQQRLKPLWGVHSAFLASPWSVRQLAGPVAGVLLLGQVLARAKVRPKPVNLLDAVHMALARPCDGDLFLKLHEKERKAVERLLKSCEDDGGEDWSGLQLRDGMLVLQRSQARLEDRIWRHDLPTLQEMQSGTRGAPAALATEMGDMAIADFQKAQEAPPKDISTQAIKQLVMNNIGSVSVCLGFLRNPKVTSIPGLVAEIVRRTRSTRVLEVIASDRKLTSGHANKDVPRALLESPVNVSIKILKRFIHVKYVSKTDLRRISKDKTQFRKDVCQEVELYLASLV